MAGGFGPGREVTRQRDAEERRQAREVGGRDIGGERKPAVRLAAPPPLEPGGPPCISISVVTSSTSR